MKEVIQDLTEFNAIESPALISEADLEMLIKKVSNKYNISQKQTFGLICIICQKVGTSKKTQGTV